eukprot:CAMPEP_0180663860 /NCGR_PEP_ID=MMETSP1037_2-20121125/60248_1 /TAXON_ID=632150 /ORGANISM="Azadinium spinosum, Strain 3D9" /LENGTH=119 /DNA_ID=CAMNT_0022691813 /DNA_START=346 /DNA_END=705 /DNA_ORIENTATION=+
MAPAAFRAGPVLGFPAQQPPDQILGFVRNVDPNFRLQRHIRALCHSSNHVAEHIQDHTRAPKVTCLIVGARINLRSHVIRRAHNTGEGLPWLDRYGQAEVGDLEALEVASNTEEEILRL